MKSAPGTAGARRVTAARPWVHRRQEEDEGCWWPPRCPGAHPAPPAGSPSLSLARPQPRLQLLGLPGASPACSWHLELIAGCPGRKTNRACSSPEGRKVLLAGAGPVWLAPSQPRSHQTPRRGACISSLLLFFFFFSTSISLVESFGRRRRVRNPPPALPGGPVTSRARCVAAGGVSSPCASGCSGSPMSCGHPKPSPGLVWVCGCVPQRPALLFAPSRSPGNVPTLLVTFPLAVFRAPSPKAVALRPPGKEQPNPALPLLLPVIPMALTPSHLWFFLQHLLGAEQEPGRALGLPCMKDRGGGRRRPPPASALETRCVGSLPLL